MSTLTTILSLPVSWIAFCLIQGTAILLLTLFAWWLGRQSLSAAMKNVILLFGIVGLAAGYVFHGTSVYLFPNIRLAISEPVPRAGIEIAQDDPMTVMPISRPVENAPVIPAEQVSTENREPDIPASPEVGSQAGVIPGPPTTRIPASALPDPVQTVTTSAPPYMSYWAMFVPYLGAIWWICSGVWLSRLCAGVIRWQVLRSRAHPIDIPQSVQPIIPHDIEPHDIEPHDIEPHDIEVLESEDATRMPMAGGVLRNAVLLPRGFSDWSEETQKIVLIHEFAHIARRDAWANMFLQIVRALAWFQPLLWIVTRLSRLESEQATDDRVIRAGVDATDYAKVLLQIVQQFSEAKSSNPVMAVGMAEQCFLTRRVNAIVDTNKKRQTTPVSFFIMSFAVALVLMVSSLWVPIDVFSLSASDEPTRRLSDVATQTSGDIEVRGMVFETDGNPCREGTVYWHNRHFVKSIEIKGDGSFEFRVSTDDKDWEAWIRGGTFRATSADGEWQAIKSFYEYNTSQWQSKTVSLTLEPAKTVRVIVKKDGILKSNTNVVATWEDSELISVKTDDQGAALLTYPQSQPFNHIWAFHTQSGVAAWNLSYVGDGNCQDEPLADDLELNLWPTQNHSVKVVNRSGQPLSDVTVALEIQCDERPRGQSERELYLWSEQLPWTVTKTNENGVASFPWVPAAANIVTPNLNEPRFRQRGSVMVVEPHHMQLTVEELVPVRGKVVGAPSGSSLRMDILILGEREMDRNTKYKKIGEIEQISAHAFTEPDGQFVAYLRPGFEHTFRARSQQWASDPVKLDLINRERKDVVNETVVLDLYPATPVTVQVVLDPRQKQPRDRRVSVTDEPDFHQSIPHSVFTDENGRATFWLGKGQWRISMTNRWDVAEEIEIRDANPVSVNLNCPYEPPQSIRAQVVLSEEGISRAYLHVRPMDYFTDFELTDANGSFTAYVHDGVVVPFTVTTRDKKYATLVDSATVEQDTIPVELAKAASLSGRVTDEQGHPIPNQSIVAMSALERVDGWFQQSVTNEDGTFELKGLVADTPIQLGLQLSNRIVIPVGSDVQLTAGEIRNVETIEYSPDSTEGKPLFPFAYQLNTEIRSLSDMGESGVMILVHNRDQVASQIADQFHRFCNYRDPKVSEFADQLQAYFPAEIATNQQLMEQFAEKDIELPVGEQALLVLLDSQYKIVDSLTISQLSNVWTMRVERERRIDDFLNSLVD